MRLIPYNRVLEITENTISLLTIVVTEIPTSFFSPPLAVEVLAYSPVSHLEILISLERLTN